MLKAQIKVWQKRLAPLGISHWSFDLKIVDDDGYLAQAECSGQYDHVHFNFTNHLLEDFDDAYVTKTIIHEWLHVAFRDFDAAERDVRDFLSRDTANMFRDRMDHEREGIIQRLSEVIYATT